MQMRLIRRLSTVSIVALPLLWIITAGGPAHGEALELDLDKCVDMALEVNVSVLKAEYELDQAGNAVITSASLLLPDVSAYSTHSKYEKSFARQVGDKVIEVDRSYTASLNVSENVAFGSVMSVFESLAGKRSTKHYVRMIRQEVSLLAKEKYLGVLKARRLLVVVQEALDLSQRRLEKAEAMLEVGSSVRSDVLRAQVELSNNELDLIIARNALRLAETDLRHFLKVDDDVDLDLKDILEAREETYSLEEALATAIELRPDVQSATESLKASRHAVWRERGAWFPSLNFRWSDGYTSDRFPDEISSLRDDAEWRWDLTASFNLFDGLYTFGRVRNAKASRSSAEEDLRQLRRDAVFEIKQAYYNVEEARQRVKVSRETVGLAEEELRLAEERFRLGGGTMLEQIDSQVALSEARTAYVDALHDYLLSQARLEKAMGKD
jgi:outer membrane protein